MTDAAHDASMFYAGRCGELSSQLRHSLDALKEAQQALKRSRDTIAREAVNFAIKRIEEVQAEHAAEDAQRHAESLARKMESNRLNVQLGKPPIWAADGRLIPLAERQRA